MIVRNIFAVLNGSPLMSLFQLRLSCSQKLHHILVSNQVIDVCLHKQQPLIRNQKSFQERCLQIVRAVFPSAKSDLQEQVWIFFCVFPENTPTPKVMVIYLFKRTNKGNS